MKTGPKPKTKTQAAKELFNEATVVNGCLIPKRQKMKSGYIRTRADNQEMYAHRLIFELHCGELAANEVVRHQCHNPSCINPEHLLKGTHADNVQDKISADRHMRGLGHYRAKLTEEDVLAIRADTTKTLTELSAVYGVSKGGIKHIKDRVTWKHI